MLQQNELQIKSNLERIFYNVADSANKANKVFNDIEIEAITKTVPAGIVNIAKKYGINLFGENKVQEYISKKDKYIFDKDHLHFVGHLQSNKVKYIIKDISMIESVDSFELAQKIQCCCEKSNSNMDILLQVNIGSETSKYGFEPDVICEEYLKIRELPNLIIKGLMCIPPKENTEYFFKKTHELFCNIKEKENNENFTKLSMGMSNDYGIAIENGANIVRIGRGIFGERQ